MKSELQDAIDWMSRKPCETCGQTLGKSWAEKWVAETDRMAKVHHGCAVPES